MILVVYPFTTVGRAILIFVKAATMPFFTFHFTLVEFPIFEFPFTFDLVIFQVIVNFVHIKDNLLYFAMIISGTTLKRNWSFLGVFLIVFLISNVVRETKAEQIKIYPRR